VSAGRRGKRRSKTRIQKPLKLFTTIDNRGLLEAFGELLHLSRAIDLVQLLPEVLHVRGILLRNVHGLLRCPTSDRIMGNLLLFLLVQDHLAFSFLLWHSFRLLSVHLHVASLVLLR
jgi:hypothetical protein